MSEMFGIRWDEFFSLSMLALTIGLPVVFLIIGFRNHSMDNLDATKYEVFSTDPQLDSNAVHASMPASTRAGTMNRPTGGLMGSKNGTWVLVTLAIGAIWTIIMLGAFLASRGFESMHQALPM